MSNLPLSGIRVIDASAVLMGPYASQWLADMGAEVIKVESPEGDSTRSTGPTHEAGMSAIFLGLNRNKKSVVIDLKQAAGRAALHSLIGSADVFMHSMRPQKLAAVELDPKQIREKFPALVYAGLHGFSQTGPYGDKPAYDDIIQGLSGSAALMAQQSGVARYFPTVVADKTSGLVAALAIVAAIIKKQSSGVGSYVEIPMFETMVAFNLVEHFYGEHFEPPLSTTGYPRVLAPWRRPYPTLDGHVCLMPYTDAHWQRLFKAVDASELAQDPRFSSMAARTQHIEQLYELTGRFVARHTSAYWLSLCQEIDIPAAPMNQLSDLKNDPHLADTGFFQTRKDPSLGELRFPGVPVLFDGIRPEVRTPPRLGADTLEVLLQCGLSAEEVQALMASGAVGPKPTN
ncbi:MAG: CoA transferase [Burkholderiaceae bacterium]